MQGLAISGGVTLHVREDGDPAGRPVVFLNSLGTDLRLWDAVLPRLPGGLRMVRMDKRGHGLSDAPRPPYAMGTLVSDAEAVCDAMGVTGAVIVGCSIGGMIAQGLATKRPDLAAALVLTNTAPRIGTRVMWQERIATVADGGTEALADAVMERWFSKGFRAGPEVAPWRRMVAVTPDAGYAGCCAAIAGTDFYTTTADLRLPALVVAGSEDGSTPPDLVRELAGLIPGAEFALIRGAGHLPMVEKPDEFAARLSEFIAGLPS